MSLAWNSTLTERAGTPQSTGEAIPSSRQSASPDPLHEAMKQAMLGDVRHPLRGAVMYCRWDSQTYAPDRHFLKTLALFIGQFCPRMGWRLWRSL